MSFALIFRETATYESVFKEFSKHYAYTIQEGGGGGLYARAVEEGCPHFILGAGDLLGLRQILLSSERILNPECMISTGIFGPEELLEPIQPVLGLLIPALCVRSVGKVSRSNRPLLYEELPFHEALQNKICEKLLRAFVDKNRRIFSAELAPKNSFEREWVLEHLKCAHCDDFSAEILLMGQSLKRPVGCLKAIDVETLTEAWLKFFRE